MDSPSQLGQGTHRDISKQNGRQTGEGSGSRPRKRNSVLKETKQTIVSAEKEKSAISVGKLHKRCSLSIILPNRERTAASQVTIYSGVDCNDNRPWSHTSLSSQIQGHR
ncbi:hypothetical protein ANN_04266 [Periplaneta americana]|uniref:Uncharacterized protein n=1 Tax=Periplaneta americana TaxID=6978 RepID=A0ABQ8T830_PERAM|nr:hypothetical protein ANN_04266 [Periplaneta americana]